MNRQTRIIIEWILVIAWMIIIFLFSSQVAKVSSAQSGVVVEFVKHSLHVSLSESILTFLTRKAAHTFIYFVLGILIYNVIKEYGFSTKKAILLSILFSIFYASSDEIHQLFVQGRSSEVTDVLIDSTGASIGVFVHYFVAKIHNARFSKKVEIR
jgi:VanZ family protein